MQTTNTQTSLDEKNSHFVQFNKQHLSDIEALMAESPLAARVFMFLVEKMDKKNACIMSSTVLTERFQKTRQSIYTAVKVLTTGGFLQTFRASGATVYTLNADVVWQDAGNKKQFAEFSGNIVIAKSEQHRIDEDGFERKIKARTTKLITVESVMPKGRSRRPEIAAI